MVCQAHLCQTHSCSKIFQQLTTHHRNTCGNICCSNFVQQTPATNFRHHKLLNSNQRKPSKFTIIEFINIYIYICIYIPKAPRRRPVDPGGRARADGRAAPRRTLNQFRPEILKIPCQTIYIDLWQRPINRCLLWATDPKKPN